MFIKDKCPISATPSGSDAMYYIFFYKCLMHIASGCKTVFLLILKNNEFSPADVHKIIQTVKKTTNMSSYDHIIQEAKKEGFDSGIEKGIEKGMNLGIEKGIEKERRVIANILAQFPNWDDEKIADLAVSTLEVVRAVRAELGV